MKYLTRDSNLSDDIKQIILASTQKELNLVATTPTQTASSAPTIVNAPANVMGNAVVEGEQVKKATEDAEAEKKAIENEIEVAKQTNP